MKIQTYPILALVLLLWSCGLQDASNQLKAIESCIEEEPKMALENLMQIDTTCLKTPKLKAGYSLLLSMALDKNFIDTANTALARPAVVYYSRHSDLDKKMKAYFYLARQYYNAKSYRESAIYYQMALECAKEVGGSRYEGLCYGSLAEVYDASYNDREALSYIDDAIKYFDAEGDSAYSKFTRFRKAQYLANLKLFDESDHIYDELLNDESVSQSLRSQLLAAYAHSLAGRLKPDLARAREYFASALKISGRLDVKGYWGAYAYCLAAGGDWRGADAIMSQLARLYGDADIYNLYWKGRILELKGDYKEALAIRNQFTSTTRLDQVLSQPAAIGQRDYFQWQELDKGRRLETTRMLIIIIALMSFVIVMWLLNLLRYKRLRAEQEKDTLLGTIEAVRKSSQEWQARESEMESRLVDLRSEYLKIYRSQFSQLAELCEIVKTEELKSGKKSLNPAEGIYKKVRAIVDDITSDEQGQTRFESKLNVTMGDVMKHFREDFPKLKSEDYRFVSCVFAGFDGIVLAQLFNLSQASVRTKKSRLRKKVASAGAALQVDYLKLFDGEQKKQ